MPRLPRLIPTRPLNLAVTDETRARLEDLLQRTASATREEVVRRALAYFDALVRIEEEGGQVIVHPKKGAPQLLRLIAR